MLLYFISTQRNVGRAKNIMEIYIISDEIHSFELKLEFKVNCMLE
jgi:hypothetical protein